MARTLPQHQPRGNTPIGRHRVRRGLSLAQAAKLADMSVPGWQNVENGRKKPQRATVSRCAAALGLTETEFERLWNRTRNHKNRNGKRAA